MKEEREGQGELDDDSTTRDSQPDDESSDVLDTPGIDDSTTTSDEDSSSESSDSNSTTDSEGPEDPGETGGTSDGLLPTGTTSDSDTSDTGGSSETAGTTDPSSKSNDTDSGETSSDTGADPGTLDYCEKGALSCYTFDRISNGHIHDYGPLNMPLHPSSGASLDTWNLETEFLKNFLVVTESTAVNRPSQSWPFTNGSAGIDVWFSVDDPGTSDFTLLQIGQYLQMSYDDFGVLRCSTWEGDTKITVSTPLFLARNNLNHVSCSYDGQQLIAGAMNLQITRSASPSPETYLKVWVANNPPDQFSAKFLGNLHAMRIWDNPTQMRNTIEEEDFAIFFLGD